MELKSLFNLGTPWKTQAAQANPIVSSQPGNVGTSPQADSYQAGPESNEESGQTGDNLAQQMQALLENFSGNGGDQPTPEPASPKNPMLRGLNYYIQDSDYIVRQLDFR